LDELNATAQALTDEAVEEAAPATDTDASSDTELFQRSLRPSGFKRLQAKFVAAQAGKEEKQHLAEKLMKSTLSPEILSTFSKWKFQRKMKSSLIQSCFGSRMHPSFHTLLKLLLLFALFPLLLVNLKDSFQQLVGFAVVKRTG